MQRRPIVLTSAALALFLLYCVSVLRVPSVEKVPASWAHLWPPLKDNGAEPGLADPEGVKETAPTSLTPSLNMPSSGAPLDDASSSHLKEEVYAFQQDIPYSQPSLNLSSLAHHHPHNLPSTGQHPTYATYFSSRNTSLHDPYFIATQQIIYRTLWSPTSASATYPFTVFVGPFIPDEQRNIFRGAGANVVELPVVEWKPTQDTYARWKDLFSKLHMWNQTQFSRIAFLDSDAFPLQNIDDIFDISTPQTCVSSKLELEDLAHEQEICEYVFAGTEMLDSKEINGGVTVLSPNPAMHAHLLRNMVKTDQFDASMVEQGFLNWQFKASGAFPTQFLPRAYNGFFPQPNERFQLKVVHEKLWAVDLWGDDIFNSTWTEMLQFYDSSAFVEMRQNDGMA